MTSQERIPLRPHLNDLHQSEPTSLEQQPSPLHEQFSHLSPNVQKYVAVQFLLAQPRITDTTKERLYQKSSELAYGFDIMERVEFMKFYQDTFNMIVGPATEIPNSR